MSKFTFNSIHVPSTKLFSLYQICSLINPSTNKYSVRKFIYNDQYTLIACSVREYNKIRLQHFISNSSVHKFIFYPSYNFSLINPPSFNDVFLSHSNLLI